MRCINKRCYSDDISIGITREVPEQNSRIRTYKCNSCGKVMLTQEYLYVPSIRVLERDGTKPYLRPEWLRDQLVSLLNLYEPENIDESLYSTVQEVCRKFYSQGKKEITRASIDKVVLKELHEQYPLLCIAYYSKYVIIEKTKVVKYFRQLLNQYTVNYENEKHHKHKLAVRKEHYLRRRASQSK